MVWDVTKRDEDFPRNEFSLNVLDMLQFLAPCPRAQREMNEGHSTFRPSQERKRRLTAPTSLLISYKWNVWTQEDP